MPIVIQFRRHAYLLFLIPPLLVLNLSAFLFEISVDPAVSVTEGLRKEVGASGSSTPIDIFKEVNARYTWLALALLDIAVPIIASVVSITVILRSATRSQLLAISGIGTLLIAASITYTFFEADGLHNMVYGYTHQTLAESGRFSDGFLRQVSTIVFAINILAAAVPIIMLLGACSTAVPPNAQSGDDPSYWARKMAQLKEIVNAGSAYLVFGILHMGVWLQWPAALTGNVELHKSLTQFAHSITLYWGVAFTLLIIATYWPVAYYLHLHAQEALSKNQDALGIDDTDAWLKRHHLSITLSSQLPQLIVMLGPFFSSPLSAMLSGLAGL